MSLIGQKFGRLTVIAEIDLSLTGRRRKWRCKCDCGNEKAVLQQLLRNGKASSCGCFRREYGAALGRARSTHGEARHSNRSKEWTAWKSMLDRCLSPTHHAFKDYGGRGIGVHEPWISSYVIFLQDVGRAPGRNYSLDRIDNEKGYFPGNIRWATWKEQGRNKRNNVNITALGQTLSISGWAEKTGIDSRTIVSRLRRGCPVEQAVLKIPRKYKKRSE